MSAVTNRDSEVIADHRGNGGIRIGYGDRGYRRLIQKLGCTDISAQEPMRTQEINSGKAAIDVFQARAGGELAEHRLGRAGNLFWRPLQLSKCRTLR
jgi:hypothetical protein